MPGFVSDPINTNTNSLQKHKKIKMSPLNLILLLLTWLIQAAHTLEDIPDPSAHGYAIRRSTPVAGNWIKYEVTYGSTFIADLATYKNDERPGVLGVFNTLTDYDNNPDRLPARALQLGVWVHHVGRDATDLYAIRYLGVYEPALRKVTHRVYELMDYQQSRDLIVFRNHHSDDEEEAYNLIHDETPFGAGAQKMIDENEAMHGKEVEAFGYDLLPSGVFHFTVYFYI